MILKNLSRLMLLAVLIAAPWMFGGVSLNSQVWLYAGIVLSILFWLVSLITGSDRPAGGSHRREPAEPWTPPMVVLCAGLVLLFTSLQLLPTSWGSTTLTHAVLADWLPPNFSWRALPAPISVTPGKTLIELARLQFAACVLLLGSVLFHERPQRTVLFAVAAANGAALATFGVIQKLTWDGMMYWNFPLPSGYPFSAFVNRNNGAGYLNLCLACGLGLLVGGLSYTPRRRVPGPQSSRTGDVSVPPNSPPGSVPSRKHSRRTRRHARSYRPENVGHLYDWKAGVILTLCVAIAVGVTASASRGGIAAMVAMLLAAGLLLARFQWTKLIVPGIAVVCAVAILISLKLDGGVRERLATLRYVEQLDDPRLPHWQDTLQAIPDFFWCGSGLGSYAYAQLPYQRHVFYAWFFNADSEYVEWLLEGGVIGFVLMALLISAALLVARRLLLSRYGPPVVDAGSVLALVLVSQLLQSATDFGISLPANQLLAAALLGSAAGRARHRRRRRIGISVPAHPPTPLTSRPARDLVLMLTSTAMLVGSAFSWNQIRMAGRVDDFLRSFPAFNQPSEEALLKTEIVLATVSRGEIPSMNVATLHQNLARLHLYRLRMSVLNELREGRAQSPFPEAALWDQTLPEYLFARLQIEKTQDRSVRLIDLLPDQASRESLQHCLRHLQRARTIEPLLRGIDVLLACLASDSQMDSTATSELLAREAVLSPVAIKKLSRLGAIAALAGDSTLACRCWHRRLVVDPSQPQPLLELAIQQFGESRVLDEVVPHESIDALIEFARVAHSERDRALEIAMQQLNGDDAQTYHRRGLIAALRGDEVSAIREYSAAIQREPFAVDRRLELAKLLQQTGDRPGALEQLEFCLSLAPDRIDIRRLLQKVQKTDSASGATE